MTWRLKGAGRMVCPSCLTDLSALLVVDTSVAINLIATRIPEEILRSGEVYWVAGSKVQSMLRGVPFFRMVNSTHIGFVEVSRFVAFEPVTGGIRER